MEASRLSGRGTRRSDEDVIVEEPLEIRIAGETLAITMRTPGEDRQLVLGFLLSEGIIGSRADVLGVRHCGRLGDEGRENTIEVQLAAGARLPVDPETGLLTRRGTLTTSACGVCGRRSIDDLMQRVGPLAASGTIIGPRTISEAVRALRENQPRFGQTGGCHAASLVDFQGRTLVTYEDVGRHNAVDKVLGARVLSEGLPCDETILVVSGRSSFEIVQKASSAGIPIVASISAPSSLAIELAQRANITLIGFVRQDQMTVYSSPERIDSSESERAPLRRSGA